MRTQSIAAVAAVLLGFMCEQGLAHVVVGAPTQPAYGMPQVSPPECYLPPAACNVRPFGAVGCCPLAVPSPYLAARPAVPCCAVPGRSIYGTPKIYVRGEPVRNVWRAITP
jgi:hypothetical protein